VSVRGEVDTGLPENAIAIVGVGLRLPGGVESLNELWSALREGRDLVTEVPPERFGAAHFLDQAAF
jgi:acyl transferase domain-containing protein